MGRPLIDSDPSERIVREVQRLYDEGFSTIPLGGADGKQPLIKFKDRRPLPIHLTTDPIRSGAASGYGIRLGGLFVLDVDTINAEVPRRLEEWFGPTPARTRTPRGGMHLYYRSDGHRPLSLKAEGLPVDVKQGENQYVVGAYSLGPDGALYSQIGAPLTWATLPELDLAFENSVSPFPAPATLAQATRAVPTGARHDYLIGVGMSVVENVRTKHELFQRLRRERNNMCADPASFPDGEVEKIADWCWKCRLENRVYEERNSEFRVSRVALDRLQGNSDAEHLYVRLRDKHGHKPGKKFPLDRQAMVKDKLTDLSRQRFKKAIDKLIDADLLEVAANHVAGKRKRQYRLLLPSQSGLDPKT